MRLSTNTIYDLSMTAILQQQSRVAQVRQQLATGEKIVTPADDPRAAAQALVVSQSIAVNEQFAASRSTAKRNLSAEENELDSVTLALTAVKPLLVQAGNGALSDADLNSLATELQGIYNQILGSANAQDGNGRYIFAGFEGETIPFTGAQGSVTYQGDMGRRELQVDGSRLMPINDPGTAVFTSVTDSAQYVGTANASNTGTGVFADLNVTDSAGTTYGNSFSVSFAGTPGNLTYTVTNTTTGTVAAAQSYEPGKPIALGNSMSVTIEDAPVAGDSFVFAQDRPQDNNILNTIAGVIEQLKVGSSSPQETAALQNVVNSAHRKLDNSLDNVLTVRASLGARLNELDALDNVGASRALNYGQTLSSLQDLDWAKAASEYALAKVALQMSRKTFLDIQKLSMFNLM